MVYPTNFLLRIKPHELFNILVLAIWLSIFRECFFYSFVCIEGRHLKRPFIDKLRVYVKSGDGGTGLPKMGGIGGSGM